MKLRTDKKTEKRTIQADWLRHASAVAIDELLCELSTRADGLASDQVDSARLIWGDNGCGQHDQKPVALRFLTAFADPFTYILVFIAAVSVLTDFVFAEAGSRDITTPLIIGIMVLVSGSLRFVQNEKSTVAAASLAEMIETLANVERDGDGGNPIPLDEVVVGDIVHLSSGDVVPADMRIIAARDLFVSQSSLTGESDPLEKRPEATREAAGCTLTDLANIVFMGSTVISGTARGVVVATGSRTMFGEATGTLGDHKRQTAFDTGIRSTSHLLMRLMAAMIPAVFLISGITKGDWLQSLLFSLSVAVGLTPEMLPVLVTSCLGKGAVDLSQDHVIVKRLDAIQDLGAIDVLCTDKTGTLTEDHIVLERHLDLKGREDARVLRYAYLNSHFSSGVKNLIDRAIIEHANEPDSGIDSPSLNSTWHEVDELPFDFERRRLSVVVANTDNDRLMICKGALEELLEVCTSVEIDGTTRALTESERTDVVVRAETLANEGMRVLGVACKKQNGRCETLTAEDERELTLIGYLAFLDPPKASSAAAIRALAEHGVETKVLTGDSARVAAHVCSSIGIPVNDILTGTDIEHMDDAELAERAQSATVFAKLSPAQKARVVTVLRSLGHAVGFMGDGVNDAAAMRASDCGISVDSAIDVAREAADIILLEKDLMVLEHGIVCGRHTYANMIKYVKITVSSNFGNIFSVLAAALFLPFLPMTAVQLLLLNLIYDLTCTALPWDNVDDATLAKPCRWNTGSIRDFMFSFGPLSSLFDVITFAALFFLICPAIAGGSWDALSAAGKTAFTAVFQAGWFIESMWTQTLAVHLVRTERIPFIQSRACRPLALLGIAGVVLVTVLPFIPAGLALDFQSPGLDMFALLIVVIMGYTALVEFMKRHYIRHHDALL